MDDIEHFDRNDPFTFAQILCDERTNESTHIFTIFLRFRDGRERTRKEEKERKRVSERERQKLEVKITCTQYIVYSYDKQWKELRV